MFQLSNVATSQKQTNNNNTDHPTKRSNIESLISLRQRTTHLEMVQSRNSDKQLQLIWIIVNYLKLIIIHYNPK